jgi:ribonuclease HIII
LEAKPEVREKFLVLFVDRPENMRALCNVFVQHPERIKFFEEAVATAVETDHAVTERLMSAARAAARSQDELEEEEVKEAVPTEANKPAVEIIGRDEVGKIHK